MKKLASSKEKKVVTINDLYAQDIVIMAKVHFTYLSFVIYKDVVTTATFKDQRSKELLILLAKIFAIKQLQLDCYACYETGYFGQGSKELLLDATKQLMILLRPHMIPLVELNTDEILDHSSTSAIGNKWGDIYEAQLERAMNSRLNKTSKLEFWETLVKPIMKANAKL